MAAVCMSNVRQMGTAQVAYANANKEMMAAGNRLQGTMAITWQAATYQFLTGNALDPNYFAPGVEDDFLLDTAYECPQAKMNETTPDIYQLSYTMNVTIEGMPYLDKSGVIGVQPKSYLNNENKFYDKLFSPAETLLIADGDTPVVTWDTAGDKDGLSSPGRGDPFDAATMNDTVRHGESLNIGRADLSVTRPNWVTDDETIPFPKNMITFRRGPYVQPSQFSDNIKLFWYGRLNDISNSSPKALLIYPKP